MKKVSVLLLGLLMMSYVSSQTWKQAAQDSIIKYRTSPLSVQVVDGSGQPVEGVSVHVKLLKHQFKWGTTVNINEVSRILANKGTFNISSSYLNHFRLFNSVTPDNAGKWKGWIDPSQRTMYLRTIDWLKSEGIANRGHTCVWESERFNAIPDVLIGQTDTAVIRNIVKSHINDNMSRLSDELYEMDVVNELVHEQHIVKGMLNAADPALEHSKWYKWAKQAAPNVDLIANEFDLFQSGNNFYQRYIEYVEKMIADGAPVDGVGMQGHFWTEMPTYDELKRRINLVKPLGLPMAVTEFDMRGKDYDDMERVMYAVFSEPQIYGFTMWGAWDGSQWRNNGPLFEEDWDLKPSGRAWLDLVHGKWSNDTTQVTDASGTFTLDAYKGIHKITLIMGDSVYVDTIMVGDEVVEVTFNKDLVTSEIPEGMIAVSGDDKEFNVYQPAQILFSSDQPESIQKVEFFEGIFMQYRDTAPDFQYEIINTYAGTRNIYAKVTAKNGYTFITDTVELTFVNKNAFPTIINAYPFRNQNYIYGDDVTIAVEASDYENQLWKAELSGYGDTVLADTSVPFQFVLPSPAPGLYQLEVKVLDSLHGFNTRNITFNVLAPDEQNASISKPLKASDDVEELNDGSIETEGDLDMGEKTTGIRFPAANIPPTATIDSAFIQFTADNTNQGEINITIQAELSGDAPQFTTTSHDLTNRKERSVTVIWTPDDWTEIGDNSLAQRTPDIKSIIDELVKLDNWTESSPVVIILNKSAEPTKRRAVSYDLNPEQAPKLFVYYKGGIDLTNPEPPEDLKITSKSGSELTIDWEPSASADVLGYFIYIDGERYDQFGTSYTRFTMQLPDQQSHDIYVTAINRYSQESAPGNTINSDDQISDITSKRITDMNAYPNPFSSQIQITVPAGMGTSLMIYNQAGQMVRKLEKSAESQNANRFVWNGTDDSGAEVPAGIYFIKSLNGGGHIPGKLIKLD